MKKITVGITAHVDSGKTTLSEAVLFRTGAVRKAGRVDDGSSALDTDTIERSRGITIFSHQAEFTSGDTHVYLLDTPGHADFAAETERTMCVLDYAVLVISATDGVQSHTSTLWKLLRKYSIPVFIFVNKMDLTGADREAVLDNLKKHLSPNCTDFTDTSAISEEAALCSDELMEKYLSDGEISDGEIADCIARRQIFPCCFGSALKMKGVDEFIDVLCRFTKERDYQEMFGAKVYKITYDQKGSRLTHLKILGGTLRMRDELKYTDASGEEVTGKISSIRFYTGDRFRSAETAGAGDVAAVTGLAGTYPGQGIGSIRNSGRAVLEPVLTYQVGLPPEVNAFDVLKDMRRLEDEDPQLHIIWNEQLKEIHLQLMGAIQLEVLTERIKTRFGYEVSFGTGAVAYKETIAAPVEGVGHYEPLRHYAEVHLILEPLERGSGLVFDTSVREDDLDKNWQRLILTHLAEKQHIGVLTGSPLTDMKITLAAGKAHLKHTEGGDFRQATYRAVRQGLMNAESVLLEPFYDYELEIPQEHTGRAIADLQHMSAEFNAPESIGEMSVITGSCPVSEMCSYQSEVIAYTRGKGKLICTAGGFRECHDPEKVIESIGYNCEADVENSADSVFCSHGAGYLVKWNEVPEHMHLPSCLSPEHDEEDPPAAEKTRSYRTDASEEELMAIFERTYGKVERDPRRAFKKTKAVSLTDSKVRLPEYTGPDYLLVDGYNIIFAWDDLRKISTENLDAARAELINMMCSYKGYTGCELMIVFDAYKVSGKHREIEDHSGVKVVYTKEAETADSYIERVSHDLSKKHRVSVATSDGLEQVIILGNGAMRISAAGFRRQYDNAMRELRERIENM